MLSPSRSAARQGIRRCSITASATFRRSTPEMSIIDIMSNIVRRLIATIRAIKAALSLTIMRPATA
ncbi:hypothetical protein E2R28_25530 [Burkholderia pseudomallei]|nr:hypothetical protein E2R28_25530 [Burkholderia pseudomallei]